MNKILIVGIVVSLILLIGVTVTLATQPVRADSIEKPASWGYGNSDCPNNGACSAEKSCGNPSCGVEETGSCGCRG